MSNEMLSHWIQAQKLRAPAMKTASPFYRNLEEALDTRRRDHNLFTLHTTHNQPDEAPSSIDFCSNDMLSLGASGALRAAFQRELDAHPDLAPGPSSSRVMHGNYAYLECVEAEIAAFHNAAAGLFVNSGFEGNVALFSAITQPGDAVLFDELVHASAHAGMAACAAVVTMPFRHNDVEAFREALWRLHDEQPLIRAGKRCVLVAVESFYSMDSDVCLLAELVDVVKEEFPAGNVQFLVDEAHSTGVVGEQGRGLVCALGLEKEIAVRLHTFGKALCASGAIVLGNSTVKAALLNLARSVVYTNAPGFPTVAAVRAGYQLLREGKTEAAQKRIQTIARCFFTELQHPSIQRVIDRGILNIP